MRRGDRSSHTDHLNISATWRTSSRKNSVALWRIEGFQVVPVMSPFIPFGRLNCVVLYVLKHGTLKRTPSKLRLSTWLPKFAIRYRKPFEIKKVTIWNVTMKEYTATAHCERVSIIASLLWFRIIFLLALFHYSPSGAAFSAWNIIALRDTVCNL